MTDLRAELRAMAEEAAKKLAWPHNSEDDVPTIESALHAAVKLGMESCKMYHIDKAVNIRKSCDAQSLSYIFAHQHEIDATWIAQLLREIEE